MKSLLRFVLAAVAVFAIFDAPASAKGFYVAPYGGGNWNDINYGDKWLTLDDKAGYVIGAAVGTSIDAVPGLRIEADLNYRRNGVDITVCHDLLEAYDSTWGLLANAVYDVPVGDFPVHPYLLAGVGYASRTGGLDDHPFEMTNAGLAYQLGAGINTTVAENVYVGVGYRFFQAPDLSFHGINADGANHAVIASVTFGLN